MKVVTILNHKGGVGKTTFCGNTAQALALSGFRVLVIDNDSQHNLSSMFGLKPQNPNIRDLYISKKKEQAKTLLKCIRKTEIENLHIITSSSILCDSDIEDTISLKRALELSSIERFYDYLLIDNAPGMDRLQATAINASNMIFVPTELKQFAIDGIVEMESALKSRFNFTNGITKIIPNFYRNVKRDNTFISALNKLFPERITKTVIPIDGVFDELVTEGKILFIHRLYSKGAAYYIKLMHELFSLNEDDLWENMLTKRKERFSLEARERLLKRIQ